MTSGNSIYRQFSDAASDIERQRRGVSESILDIQAQTKDALRQEGLLWKKFASFHIQADIALPADVETALAHRLQGVEAKKAEVGEHTRLISVAKKQVAIFDGKIADLTGEIAASDAEIRERFLADDRVKPLNERVSNMAANETLLKEKLDRAVTERDSKRKPYEADEHFVYLRTCGFGTANYKTSFAIYRRFDRKLANALNFLEVNKDYERLLAVPGWIEERIADQKPAFDKDKAELEVLGHEFFDELLPKKDQLEKLKDQRQQALDQSDEQGRALAKVNQFLADAALAQDSDLQNIVADFADKLSQKGFGSLEQMASATASKEDDQILNDLRGLQRTRANLDAEVSQKKALLSDLEQKLAGLRQIEEQIDQNNWNGSGHTFNGVDSSNMLNSYLAGMLTESMIINQLDNSHRDPPPPPPPPVSYSPPSSGGSWSSSSNDTSSSNTSIGGSSSSDDDYKTSGGFGGDATPTSNDDNYTTQGGF